MSLALRDGATIASALREAAGRIESSEARSLLAHVLSVPRAQLVAHPERALQQEAGGRFAALVARRAAGEPVAYILGEREFWGLALCVSPAVLIPRPETELLVERALELLPHAAPRRVLDLGTGSGAVAIAIARERPRARLVATDVSADALDVARHNARRHGVSITFALGDWFEALADEQFDLIVSNPPYVASSDAHLARGDVRFEPRVALDGGDDGLECIRRIAREAYARLAPGGRLALEHGFDQGAACRDVLLGAGYADVKGFTDLSGHPRACVGHRAC